MAFPPFQNISNWPHPSMNALGQPLPGKVCHRAIADIEVEQGNHAVRRGGRPVAAEPGPITIFHYPMRSYRQFTNKIVKGGSAYERNPDPHIGATWRHLYEVWKTGGLEPFYRSAIVDDAAIEEGLKNGRLVREERLKDFFSGLRARPRRAVGCGR